MASSTMFSFHLSLPEELHTQLREEVERSGQSATSLARQALVQWLGQRKNQRLHDEIKAFARTHAGTSLDLDEPLEQAGVEALFVKEPE